MPENVGEIPMRGVFVLKTDDGEKSFTGFVTELFCGEVQEYVEEPIPGTLTHGTRQVPALKYLRGSLHFVSSGIVHTKQTETESA